MQPFWGTPPFIPQRFQNVWVEGGSTNRWLVLIASDLVSVQERWFQQGPASDANLVVAGVPLLGRWQTALVIAVVHSFTPISGDAEIYLTDTNGHTHITIF